MTITSQMAACLGRWAMGGMALVGVVGCSPLRTFNALMPKDGGVTVAVRDAPFGTQPRQRLDVYVPSPRGGRQGCAPLPVIVFFYGGSWNSGERQGYSFVGHALAARGFVVVIPDYRLVPQVHYPAFLQDNAAAVHWARSHAAALGGDPDRLVLMGHSAGAYNAAMLALDPRWLGADRAAVRALVGLAGPYDFLPFNGDIVQHTFQGVANPASTQPVTYAVADAHPTLPAAFLATAGHDTAVQPRNSDALASALRGAGVAVERKTYAGVGHAGLITALAMPLRGRASVLTDVVTFVHDTVKTASCNASH